MRLRCNSGVSNAWDPAGAMPVPTENDLASRKTQHPGNVTARLYCTQICRPVGEQRKTHKAPPIWASNHAPIPVCSTTTACHLGFDAMGELHNVCSCGSHRVRKLYTTVVHYWFGVVQCDRYLINPGTLPKVLLKRLCTVSHHVYKCFMGEWLN